MIDTPKPANRTKPHAGKEASPWSKGPNCHTKRARQMYRELKARGPKR